MTSICDKSWMKNDKSTREYFRGCKDFVEFAWANKPAEYGNKIYCPCIWCTNQKFRTKDDVLDHIRRFGISRNYTCWRKHGESEEVNVIANDGDDMHGMLRYAFTTHNFVEMDSGVANEPNLDQDEFDSNCCSSDEPNNDAYSFFKLLKEAETPLFPGSTKSTKLSFVVRLLHAKCINGWSNKSVDMLLANLGDSLPGDINMPKNYYEAKKLLKDLGMECIKIDACPEVYNLKRKLEEKNEEMERRIKDHEDAIERRMMLKFKAMFGVLSQTDDLDEVEGETIHINVKNKPSSGARMLSAAGLSGNGKPKAITLAPPFTGAVKIKAPLLPPPNVPATGRISLTNPAALKGPKENARHSTDPFNDLSQLKNKLPTTKVSRRAYTSSSTSALHSN